MAEFLTHNFLLVAIFLASGAMLIWPELLRFGGSAGGLGTLDATRLMNQGGTLILDVRDAAEFGGGHLPRARNIPLAQLASRAEEIAKFREKPVIVTCGSGSRSASAVRLLRRAGFTAVYSLKGGLAAWQQASLPVER